MITTQFGIHVKVVRSDNGTNFFSSQCIQLFNDLGILHQSSCSHIPQQNGVVERKHRHIPTHSQGHQILVTVAS